MFARVIACLGRPVPSPQWIIIIGCLILCSTHALSPVPAGLVTKEYCQWEKMNASCPSGSVILVHSARYGRMRLGRCVTSEYKVGCSADVLAHLDSRCSGRRRCAMDIPDEELHRVQPCPKDLGAYLQISYTCLRVVRRAAVDCTSRLGMVLSRETGYISSYNEDNDFVGGSSCPYQIHAGEGQQINVTLFDFGLHSKPLAAPPERQPRPAQPPPPPPNHCRFYAVIRERDSSRDFTVCGGQERQNLVYTSRGNSIELQIVPSSRATDSKHFLLKYKVIGCSNIRLQPYAIVRRTRERLTVSCNNTGKTWHLVCKETRWVGRYQNCTASDWRLRSFVDNKGRIRYPGIMIAIIIGVVLGAIFGIAMLFVVLVCRRQSPDRKRPNAQSSKNTVTRAGRHGNSENSMPLMPCTPATDAALPAQVCEKYTTLEQPFPPPPDCVFDTTLEIKPKNPNTIATDTQNRHTISRTHDVSCCKAPKTVTFQPQFNTYKACKS